MYWLNLVSPAGWILAKFRWQSLLMFPITMDTIISGILKLHQWLICVARIFITLFRFLVFYTFCFPLLTCDLSRLGKMPMQIELYQSFTHPLACATLEWHLMMEVLWFLLGVQPLSIRQVKFHIERTYPSMAWMVPEFVYVPAWLVGAATHKL